MSDNAFWLFFWVTICMFGLLGVHEMLMYEHINVIMGKCK